MNLPPGRIVNLKHRSRGQILLIVDDEPAVRPDGTVGAVSGLQKTACNAEEALQVIGSSFQLAVIDVMMRGDGPG